MRDNVKFILIRHCASNCRTTVRTGTFS